MPKNLAHIATLDQYGFPINAGTQASSPLPQSQSPYAFGMNQKIQADRIKTTGITLLKGVKLTQTLISLGTVASGGSLFLSTQLVPQSPVSTIPVFAQALIGVFLGTITTSYTASQQLYPTIGTPANTNKWDIRGDLDYNGIGGTLSGTLSVWQGIVLNNSGAIGTVQFVSRWRYLDFTGGTVLSG